MFGRNLQGSAHMIPAQFFHKLIVLVCKQIIITNPGTDKDLLYLVEASELLSKNIQVFQYDRSPSARMVLGKGNPYFYRLPTSACFLAGRSSEVSSRAANIVDVPLEVLFSPSNVLASLHDGFLASAAHLTPLMVGKSAETASAEASAVCDDAELSLLQLPEHRRPSHSSGWYDPFIRKFINIVQFFCAAMVPGADSE